MSSNETTMGGPSGGLNCNSLIGGQQPPPPQLTPAPPGLTTNALANSRTQGAGQYSTLGNNIVSNPFSVNSTILAGNIIPNYDGFGPGPGGGGTTPKASMQGNRANAIIEDGNGSGTPSQAQKMYAAQQAVQVTRKRSSMMSHYPPLAPQSQQQIVQQQQSAFQEITTQMFSQPSPHAKRQSPAPTIQSGIPTLPPTKISSHHQYLQQMMQANGLHPSLMQVLSTNNSSTTGNVSNTGQISVQTLSNSQKHQQIIMDYQQMSPKMRPPGMNNQGQMNTTMNSSIIDQQFVNLKNSIQNNVYMKKIVNYQGMPIGGNIAPNMVIPNQNTKSYRQKSVPYQSAANGIAGILGNQVHDNNGGEIGDDSQVDNEMCSSVIVAQDAPTTRTDISQSSPMKVFRQVPGSSQLTTGLTAGSSTSANSSIVSTALSSSYVKRKIPAPPVTVQQAQIQPSPIQSKMTNQNNSFVQPQPSQPLKAISSSTISSQQQVSQQPSGFQQQSQPQQQQQLIIITVSNSQPNASGAVQKKLTSNAGSGNGPLTGDHKDPKQSLLLSIQEVVRLVVQRSEDINLLRQIVDLKTKKLKAKYTDSSFFYNQLQREWQRQSVEGYHLNKTQIFRVEDKSPLIKILQKQVKKMLKPFNRRRPNEDYLQSEVHLSEVMMQQESEQVNSLNFQQQLQNSSSTSLLSASEANLNISALDQPQRNQNPLGYLNAQVYPPAQYKDLRKRNVRIIQASFKEQLVDPQVALSICIQYSRQAFFDELLEYFTCIHDLIVAGAPGTLPSNCNLQTENFNYQNLKKVITKARQQSRVQLNLQKKLEKVYKVLFDANTEILKQINIYKEKYNEQKKKLVSRQMLLENSFAIKKQHQSLSPQKTNIFQSEIQQQQLLAMKHQQSFTVSQDVTARSSIQVERVIDSKRTQGSTQNNLAAPQPPQPATTPITSNETQLNSSIQNFGGINKASFQLMRGQSRGTSKLQPIIVPRNDIILKNQSVMDNSSLIGDTSMNNAEVALTRTIKKVNQLPALDGNQMMNMPPSSSDFNNILGTPITNKTLSKRALGLEPLSSDHQLNLEAKVAALKHHGDSQSVSPLKRRNKVVIQGGLSNLGISNNGENTNSLGSPLLKAFHSSTSNALGTQYNEGNEEEAFRNGTRQDGTSSRKVIKATITIPMPKADMGVIKFKTKSTKSNINSAFQQQQQDVSDNSFEDSNEFGGDAQKKLFYDEEKVDSPDISIVLKDSSFINNTIVATASLLNQPMSALTTVRQSSSQSKIGGAKSQFMQYQSNSPYPGQGLSPMPSNNSQLYFQRMMLDMSQFPVNDRFDSLFSRYFNKKGIMAFVLNHRAKVIQRFFRQRIQYKLAAKSLIVKRFRFYVARQQRVHLFATKLFITVTQKKAVRVIERAYLRYRDRQRSTFKRGNLSQDAILSKYIDNIVKLVKIQRFFRKRRANKFILGRKLVKRLEMQESLFHEWWQQRYIPLVQYESQLLHNEIQFRHNRQFIDEYVYQESESYMASLFQYDQGLVQAVEKNFREREWDYSKPNREWINDRIPFTFKSMQDSKQAGQLHPALQYLIDTNRRLVMSGPYQGLEDIQGVSEALNGLLATEIRNQRKETLGKIKRIRVGEITRPKEGSVIRKRGGMVAHAGF